MLCEWEKNVALEKRQRRRRRRGGARRGAVTLCSSSKPGRQNIAGAHRQHFTCLHEGEAGVDHFPLTFVSLF